MKISDTGSGIPINILNNWGKAFNLKDKGNKNLLKYSWEECSLETEKLYKKII